MDDRVQVASYASRPLAELARGYLAEHDLLAVVGADDGNGTQPEVGFVTGGAQLYVAAGDARRARGLLDAVDAAPSGATALPRRGSYDRWVAGLVAATMALIGVWTTVVVLLRI